MTVSEFTSVLAWLLLPPVLLGVISLALVNLHYQGTFKRCALACVLLVVLSCLIAFIMVAFGPKSLGSLIGVRDTPFMWAPFAFVAVVVAFPFTALCLRNAGANKL